MSTSKETRDWYSQNAEQYARHVSDPSDSIYHAYYEKPAMQSELPDVRGKDVLSLACGSGVDTHHLKSIGANRAAGIDITPELIAVAQRNYPDCEFQVMDMESLKFENETFDLAYSSLAVHYLLGGPYKMFSEAFRVLKSGGTMLFSDSHPLGTAMETVVDNDDTREKKLGITNHKKDNNEEDFGDYFSGRAMQPEEGWVVDYWHQPLGATINQLIEAGFVLDKIVEFQPTEEMKKVNPRVYNRLMRIPEMLLIKAHKP